MIQNIEEAKAVLRQILGLSDGKQQVVRITFEIGKCIDNDARKFLSAARERILRLQAEMKTRKEPAPGAAPVAPAPAAQDTRAFPETAVHARSGPAAARKADEPPVPQERKDEALKPRRVVSRLIPRAGSSGPDKKTVPMSVLSADDAGSIGDKPIAPESAGARLANDPVPIELRARRKTESFEVQGQAGETDNIPILPEDRILDEEFVLMFESLEKFVAKGISVKPGPPPVEEADEAGLEEEDEPGGEPLYAPPESTPATPSEPAKPRPPEPGAAGKAPSPAPAKTVPADLKKRGSAAPDTLAFSEIRQEIEEAGPAKEPGKKDETREYRKENLQKAVADFNEIVSEIEGAEEDDRRYTGTRAFIRGNDGGNVVFIDAWNLHPEKEKAETKTGVTGAAPPVPEAKTAESGTVPPVQAAKAAASGAAASAQVAWEEASKKPSAPAAGTAGPDLAHEVLKGLQQKAREKQSPTEELARKAPPIGEPPAAPAALRLDFPSPVPGEIAGIVDACCGILAKAGREVPRPIVTRTVAENPAVSAALAEKAAAFLRGGDDTGFKEACAELYSNLVTWKVRYARRLTRIERYLRSLLAGTQGKAVNPAVTQAEFQAILDHVFQSIHGIETFSAFTISGPSEDKEAFKILAKIIEMIRKAGDR